ncbi:hypothetical protein GL218_02812 [Daldinia childiae]|uniref:uncharacterized protein n=1 Tax=Daldinia childiae TaxID=326645 RepID=UPI00144649FD|nr:uncharacterized protein GL218_02812 [Daldinia childiae]KAF3061149.1 hypothetical protein GL218_02812 [Daldinia childiae]
MTTAMHNLHSSGSSNHQQTPGSTAPVLEYVCLFTRDLRRKQKRWQDGRLKYHTFNKRIMVYDERGNFVGDTHWHEDYHFDEGEEVELERGGTIVQVAECTGSRDQDLSELIDKRARERAERQSAALARRPPTVEAATPNVTTPNVDAPHFQLRHKPLHNLIGTPTGHHGRALVPTESPYEERQKLATSTRDDDGRPAKRRKREVSPPSKSGYAQSLFGASLTLSGTPTSSPLLRSRPPKVISVSADDRPLSSAIPSTHAEKDTENQMMTDGDDLVLQDDVPAPRLAQLGRRNVRSKEVIGFFFDEEIDSGPKRNEGGEYGKASLASGFSANHSVVQPLAKEARAVSNGVPPEFVEDRNIGTVDVEAISCLPQKKIRPTSARVSGNSDVQALSDDTAATRLPTAKMVVNPATRGKKAAKPSDAAGHVPQCPLPSEVALGRPPDTKRHEHDEQKATSKVRRKASAAAMPVFARANGGPWSREAHDLFEFTRPP